MLLRPLTLRTRLGGLGRAFAAACPRAEVEPGWAGVCCRAPHEAARRDAGPTAASEGPGASRKAFSECGPLLTQTDAEDVRFRGPSGQAAQKAPSIPRDRGHEAALAGLGAPRTSEKRVTVGNGARDRTEPWREALVASRRPLADGSSSESATGR